MPSPLAPALAGKLARAHAEGAAEARRAQQEQLEAAQAEAAAARAEAAAAQARAAAAQAAAEEASAARAQEAQARGPRHEPMLDLDSQPEPPGGRTGGGAAAGSNGGDGGEATEAAADREFNFRLLALRQYTDTKRDYAGKGAKNQWNWRVHRTNPGRGQDLCGDVLKLMKGAKKQDVWRPTYVTFVAADGNEEDGEDSGGLTSEAHSVFWREVTAAPYARTELEPGTSRAVSMLPLTNGLCLGTGAACSLMGCPRPTRPWRR